MDNLLNGFLATAGVSTGLAWVIANYVAMFKIEQKITPKNFYISHAMLYANRGLNISLMVASFLFTVVLVWLNKHCFALPQLMWCVLPMVFALVMLILTVSVSTAENPVLHTMYAIGAMLGALVTMILFAVETRGMVIGMVGKSVSVSVFYSVVAALLGVLVVVTGVMEYLAKYDPSVYNIPATYGLFDTLFCIGENGTLLLFYLSLYLLVWMRKKDMMPNTCVL